MLPTLLHVLSYIAVSTAHSWLGCTNHENELILEWMRGNATRYKGPGDLYVDTFDPGLAAYCKGWPRAKHNPGNWIEESSNYLWNIAAESQKGDTHVCHPSQRTPNYFTSEHADMATTTPGGQIRLMFGGNGHSRGANVDGSGSAGTVAVYWKGGKEKEIENIEELTEENKLREIGFADEAFVWPENKDITTPGQGMLDKGNWMTVHMPEDMEKGRHMFVWAWKFGGKPRWSTCFDVMIQ